VERPSTYRSAPPTMWCKSHPCSRGSSQLIGHGDAAIDVLVETRHGGSADWDLQASAQDEPGDRKVKLIEVVREEQAEVLLDEVVVS